MFSFSPSLVAIRQVFTANILITQYSDPRSSRAMLAERGVFRRLSLGFGLFKEIRGMSKKLSERNNNRGVRCLYGNGDLSARDDRPSAGNFYLSWLMYIVW